MIERARRAAIAAPKRRIHAAVGALLSLGAPLGLLALRCLQYGEVSRAWAQGEIDRNRAIYAYVSLSTLLAFALFGYVLGLFADRLVELSTTDSLTGLRNRRALFERMREELARAARHEQPVSLLLIDVDRLKEINDREGHRAGDAALQLVASALRGGSRSIDLAARWGGDEFALLAPNTGSDAAQRLAERVRELAAEAKAIEGRIHATISVGIATATRGSGFEHAEALVRAADAALYEAKRAGRNRTAVTSPPDVAARASS